MWLRKHLNSNLLTVENLIAKEYSPQAAAARKHYQKMKVGWTRRGQCSRLTLTAPSASRCLLG